MKYYSETDLRLKKEEKVVEFGQFLLWYSSANRLDWYGGTFKNKSEVKWTLNFVMAVCYHSFIT